jgi:nucleoside-diphosphate-sugar epimerase
VNVDGTLNLARQAVQYGVKRFVFISSIGVNGAATTSAPFTADDTPDPRSPYAVSKLEAEIGLRRIALKEGLEVVIVRPPLVYGPRAPGNFAALLKCVRQGVPLPLGSARNLRSFVAIDNLMDLIIRCAEHDHAANQVFLVSDGEDLSVADFLRRLAGSLGRPPRLVPVPNALLNFLALAFRRQDLALRLCAPLQIDIAKTRAILDWSPVVSVNEGLKRIADELLLT